MSEIVYPSLCILPIKYNDTFVHPSFPMRRLRKIDYNRNDFSDFTLLRFFCLKSEKEVVILNSKA